jgi:hypothetical protein
MVMGAIVHGVYPFCSSVGSMFIHQLPWSFRQPIGNDLPNKICQVGTHCWLKKTLDVHHVTVWLWVLILSSRGCFLWRIAKTRFPCKTLDRGDQALQRYILCQTATRHLYYLDAKCLQSFSIRFIEGGNESYWWFPFQPLIINGDIHSIILYIFFVIKPPSLSCLYPQHPASLFRIQLWRYGRNRSGGRKHQGATNR